MRARIVTAAVVAAILPLGSSALAGSMNLLPNGDFEGSGSGSLAGWKGQGGSIALVTGDGGGFGARSTWGGAVRPPTGSSPTRPRR